MSSAELLIEIKELHDRVDELIVRYECGEADLAPAATELKDSLEGLSKRSDEAPFGRHVTEAFVRCKYRRNSFVKDRDIDHFMRVRANLSYILHHNG